MKSAIFPQQNSKPKMLILELWGLGDLAIATPFLRSASEKFQVTLLAKPHALELQKKFWPDVKVIPFTAPWTAFKSKYQLFSWPWGKINRLLCQLRAEKFDVAVSGRWDPRDHLLLKFIGADERLGFPRRGSGILLTKSFPLSQNQHRYENWRTLGQAMGLNLPAREKISVTGERGGKFILIHSGAAQSVRVWPLERFQFLAKKLRALDYSVKIICDSNQEKWWQNHGEPNVVAPKNISSLLELFHQSALFIGNDSGPGHLAAVSGVPTFSIFGPQVPELFIPLHPEAEWIEGKFCPHKPCSDYCRFPAPHCILNLTEAEVFEKVESFAKRIFAVEEKMIRD
jgi:ADP-heptose:LPS heptosyltransferase